MTTSWSNRMSDRVFGLKPSAIREILKVTQQPEVISFAGGLPAPELFPVERIQQATDEILQSDEATRALQYHPTEGHVGLRTWLVKRMRGRGIPCGLDNVLITSGSQQSLDLIGKVLISRDDVVAVERPTFLGMMQAWDVYGARYDGLRMDDDGVEPDDLERALKGGAKAVYIIPNFHNPTGITTSAARRRTLTEITDRYGVPVVEDDPYGQLRYEGDAVAAMAAFDAERLGIDPRSADGPVDRGNVLFLGSFSKELCPGLRVSWIVGPTPIINALVQAKQAADLHTSTLAQMIVARAVQDGFIDAHIQTLTGVYKQRRDLMLGYMQTHFPSSVSWTRPAGGLFIWVRLPEGTNATSLLDRCLEKKVAFVPGHPFFPDRAGENTFRLNFSNAQPAQIEVGITRIAEVLRRHL